LSLKSTLSEKQINQINQALEELAELSIYRYPKKHQFIQGENTKNEYKRKDSATRQSLYQKEVTRLSWL
jgi:hypothetical protein